MSGLAGQLHLSTVQLMERYSPSVWHKRPKGREFSAKQIIAFIKKLKADNNGDLLSQNTRLMALDEWLIKYERSVVEFISQEILKDQSISQTLFAIAPSDRTGNVGQAMWIRDPFNLDRTLDTERAALAPAAKATHMWLAEFTEKSALYHSKTRSSSPR